MIQQLISIDIPLIGSVIFDTYEMPSLPFLPWLKLIGVQVGESTTFIYVSLPFSIIYPKGPRATKISTTEFIGRKLVESSIRRCVLAR